PARRSLAVPAAVLELRGEEAVDQAIARLTEICARRKDGAVQTRLGLALEEGTPVELPPGDAVAHPADRPPDFPARRVHAQLLQHTKGVDGGHPAFVVAGAPMAIQRLTSEEFGAPTFRSDARALGGDDLSGRTGQVAQDLPADRRIRIQQPPDN